MTTRRGNQQNFSREQSRKRCRKIDLEQADDDGDGAGQREIQEEKRIASQDQARDK